MRPFTCTTVALLATAMTIAPAVHAEAGFFGCDGTRNCSVRKTTVAGSQPLLGGEPYDAIFEIDYSFQCSPLKMPSWLSISAGDPTSTATPSFGHADHLRITGKGPVTVTDTAPRKSASLFVVPGCDLTLNVTSMRPSSNQAALWVDAAAHLAASMTSDVKYYKHKEDVRLWYDVYVGSADGRGALAEFIATLDASPADDDHALAADLRKVLQGFPLDDVLKPYNDARARLEADLKEADRLDPELALVSVDEQNNLRTAKASVVAALQ